MANYAF